ncbi:MAG TPA: RICIN domain-containing protein [Blastocatellia bacterium]|nr:RICIN domain-containing protein [Blastocatellia bacterium]
MKSMSSPFNCLVTGLLSIFLVSGLSTAARTQTPNPWKWTPLQKDGCVGPGLRQVSARLMNIPAGTSWDFACQNAPRNVMGIDFPRPDRCVNLGLFGEYGQWNVPDTSCLAVPPAAPRRGGDGQLKSGDPLEGYADLHVHQMGHLGFGGSVLWGGAFGLPEQVLGPIPQSMKLGHDKSEAFFDGDILGGLLGLTTHGEAGWPSFQNWPSRVLATHQQVYEDWLLRAYQGGLRLMVMLAVNSEDMFGRGENDIPLIANVPTQTVKAAGRTGNDMEALEWQVREAYRMQDYIDARYGGPGRGWYRIVRDPDEASAVIAGGKLAVILGTELQHLFNCDADRPACTQETIIEGLNRLEAMGVNYVFPIHHKLNQFGGSAQFNPLTNGATEDCVETTEQCSATGLTSLGNFLVQELTTRGMLVDTEHLSWKAFDDTLNIAESRNYPVLASHINFFDLRRDSSQTEFLRKTGQVRRILGVGGIAGISVGTGSEEFSPNKTTPVQIPLACGGASPWANAYLYARNLAGGLSGAMGHLALGSDWNGFSAWPEPRFGSSACQPRTAVNGQPIPQPAPIAYPFTLPGQLVPAAIAGPARIPRYNWMTRTWDYNNEGLMHVGLMPDFFEDLRLVGLTLADLEPLYRSARGVVDLWRTARDREVPGDRNRVRWVPQSPFDVLQFEYSDRSRNVEAQAGLPLCRSRRGHQLGFERNGVCELVDGSAPPASPTLAPAAISAYHSGRCLDVDRESTSDGATVQQYGCQGKANQQWRLRSNDRLNWEIVNVNSGKCLEVQGGSMAAGARVQQNTCNGGRHQKWEAIRSGNTFSLRALHSGLSLTVADQSRANSAAVQQEPFDGASDQLWEIESLRENDYELLYQADRGRIAWRTEPDVLHPVAVTVDGTRSVCRSLDAAAWVGVVSGNQCVGRTYNGAPAATASFERLFQSR